MGNTFYGLSSRIKLGEVKMDIVKTAAFLKELRKEKNWTQEELAEKIGTTNKTISRWETGIYLPPVEILQELSKIYNVSINEILSGERLNEENYKMNAEKNLEDAVKELDLKASKSYKWVALKLVGIIVVPFLILLAFTKNEVYTLPVLSAFFMVFIPRLGYDISFITNTSTTYKKKYIYSLLIDSFGILALLVTIVIVVLRLEGVL